MQKFWMVILSCVVTLAVVGSVSAGGRRSLECKARLSGDQEVPPVRNDTTGKFRIRFNDDETKAEYRLEVRDGEKVTQAHIHCAPAGKNGPIVAFLGGCRPPECLYNVDGTWIRNVELTDGSILATVPPSATCPNDIKTLSDLAQAGRDGNLYANVHSVASPGGAVRGQLECEDDED